MTSKLITARGERQAKARGLDPGRIPPGQYLTERFPVLTYGDNPPFDLDAWSLSIWGEVESPYTLRWDELMALPQHEITVDIHCVTRWSRFDTRFRGVHWRELASRARPRPSARYVVAHAEQGFTSNVPLAAIEDENALLAYEADGEPLTPEHGWPLRLVIPGKYFWKSAKWLRGIELSASDKPGFWERYGYHNDADPWQEQRYGF